MDKQSIYQDRDYLRNDQYRDSRNLDARAALHRRFTVAAVAWLPWVFDHLALQSGERVLECGCGPGWLWRENSDRIPAGCDVTLTDLSPGMVAEAEAALAGGDLTFHFQVANVEALPFDDGAFDVVVANHMLYHVAERPRALAEVRRVLKPGGRFYAATNGRNHMRELWEMRQQLLLPERQEPAPGVMELGAVFSLENGRQQLEPWFTEVALHRYESSLAVTEVEPLLAYALSSTEARASVTEEMLVELRRQVGRVIADKGAFHIRKDMGLFTALKGV
ncbi:MAG TPA: class I SAM-dependent methyltransferase [Anaerolineae bacterium]